MAYKAKERVLGIRVNEDEYNVIAQAAESKDVAIAAYIRQVVLQHANLEHQNEADAAVSHNDFEKLRLRVDLLTDSIKRKSDRMITREEFEQFKFQIEEKLRK